MEYRTGPAPLRVAVASGKGGTGKTSLAVALALLASEKGRVRLADLDVEAPDSLAYLPDAVASGDRRVVDIPVPRVDQDACDSCGLCARACRFGAILVLPGVTQIDTNLCKGCGRCVRVCPRKALTERPVEAGSVQVYEDGALAVIEGRLRPGDIRSTAVIDAAVSAAAGIPADLEIRDCPPGATCPLTRSLRGADYAVLVAEPSAYSAHDLAAAARVVREMGIPGGIVVNKAGASSPELDAAIAGSGLTLLGSVPFDTSLARDGAEARPWRRDGPAGPAVRAVLEAVEALDLAGRKA
ncbi:MAG: 4Fe-4S binding protein [Spirochaetales bacterium]|nr:4Fe-4S binding protein [Spirochaetales bacterium]